jgi:hypothetical protein
MALCTVPLQNDLRNVGKWKIIANTSGKNSIIRILYFHRALETGASQITSLNHQLFSQVTIVSLAVFHL